MMAAQKQDPNLRSSCWFTIRNARKAAKLSSFATTPGVPHEWHIVAGIDADNFCGLKSTFSSKNY